MAWLHAAPKQAGRNGGTAGRRSRLEGLMKSGAASPRMPPVEVGGALLAVLMSVGPASAGAAGAVAVSHADILAWSELMGTELLPWEVDCVRSLSREYVSFKSEAEDPTCAPPWTAPALHYDRGEVSNRLRAAFSARAQASPRARAPGPLPATKGRPRGSR